MMYPTKGRAIDDIASWIESRYNYIRLYSVPVYRIPNEVEREFLDLTTAD